MTTATQFLCQNCQEPIRIYERDGKLKGFWMHERGCFRCQKNLDGPPMFAAWGENQQATREDLMFISELSDIISEVNATYIPSPESLTIFEAPPTPEQQIRQWWDKAITLGQVLKLYALALGGIWLVVWLATRGGK